MFSFRNRSDVLLDRELSGLELDGSLRLLF